MSNEPRDPSRTNDPPSFQKVRDWTKTRFGEILEFMPDGIVITDVSGTIVLVNSRAEKLFGHERDDLISQAIEILTPESVRERHVGHRNSYVGAPSVRPMGTGGTLLGLRRDGREFPVEISLSPMQTDVGLLVCASVRDVTDRKTAEQALLESEDKFRTIFESVPECVKLLDADDNLLDMNATGLRMVEADSIDQVRGKPIGSLIAPEYLDAFTANARNVHHGESNTLEFEIVGLRGTRLWLETHQVPIRGESDKTTLLAITRDVTQRKLAEEARRDDERRVEERN
ncbi:MAG: PAS domain S-box protein, partial [Planctomycetales bacterium]